MSKSIKRLKSSEPPGRDRRNFWSSRTKLTGWMATETTAILLATALSPSMSIPLHSSFLGFRWKTLESWVARFELTRLSRYHYEIGKERAESNKNLRLKDLHAALLCRSGILNRCLEPIIRDCQWLSWGLVSLICLTTSTLIMENGWFDVVNSLWPCRRIKEKKELEGRVDGKGWPSLTSSAPSHVFLLDSFPATLDEPCLTEQNQRPSHYSLVRKANKWPWNWSFTLAILLFDAL